MIFFCCLARFFVYFIIYFIIAIFPSSSLAYLFPRLLFAGQEARSEALAQEGRASVAETEVERLDEEAAVYKEAYERRRFLFITYKIYKKAKCTFYRCAYRACESSIPVVTALVATYALCVCVCVCRTCFCFLHSPVVAALDLT